MMKKMFGIMVGLMFMAAAISPANATTTWSWSYVGDGLTASGILTTAGPAAISEPILSISGTRTGGGITGLVALGSDGGFLYDNKFSAVPLFFTYNGVLMDVSGGVGHVNIYSNGGQLYDFAYSDIPPGAGFNMTGIPITFQVSQVPEPATMLLLGLGLVGVGIIRRKRS